LGSQSTTKYHHKIVAILNLNGSTIKTEIKISDLNNAKSIFFFPQVIPSQKIWRSMARHLYNYAIKLRLDSKLKNEF